MRAGGAPIAALLLISATLVIKVTSEDIYWEGEEDGSNEFLEVKEHDSSLSSHLPRIKRQWFSFDFWGSSSTTTAEPDTEDSTGDPVADSLTFDDETGDGSGAPSPVETSEPREKTLRVTFVAMQPYHEEYSNRDSARFQNFSKSLANAVNKIYEEQGRIKEISGTQRASLVRIQSRTSDDFSCKVTLDIATTGYYDMDKITQILRNHIRNVQRLDGVVVKDTEEDFSANVIDPAANESCPVDWIRCDAGSCLAGSVRCNGVRDCLDGTDEAGCHPDDSINEISHREDEIPRQPVTERPLPPVPDITEDYTSSQECNRDELQCDYTRCVSLTKRCDGTSDCEDNADEKNCAPIVNHLLKKSKHLRDSNLERITESKLRMHNKLCNCSEDSITPSTPTSSVQSPLAFSTKNQVDMVADDPDKAFLQSILFDMKSMTEREKIDFKFEVMSSLKRIKNKEYLHSFSSPMIPQYQVPSYVQYPKDKN